MKDSNESRIIPFAVEAAWVTGRWGSLAELVEKLPSTSTQDFNMSVATVFGLLHKRCTPQELSLALSDARDKVASTMDFSATASFQVAHDALLKCHALADVETIVKFRNGKDAEHQELMKTLDGRLEVIGAYHGDKQYLLGIRRAAMELSR
jgi:serine/threonine-protein kinase ATR